MRSLLGVVFLFLGSWACTDASSRACHVDTADADISILLQSSVSVATSPAHRPKQEGAKEEGAKEDRWKDTDAEQTVDSIGVAFEQNAASGNYSAIQTFVDAHHQGSDRGVDGSIVYRETFEDRGIGSSWCTSRSGSTCKVRQGSGNRYLDISYKPSARGSGRLGKSSKIHPPSLAANLSYDVFFGTDFEWVKGGKLGAGLFGGKGTTGCKPIVPDGWSARLMWRRGGQLEMYLYHQRRRSKCGDSYFAMDGKSRFLLKRGVWYNLKLSITLNDPKEASNGKAELFVDGVSRVVAEGLQWQKADGAKIDAFRLSTFYGGSNPTWSPSTTTHIKYDNFVVRTTSPPKVPGAFCKKGIKKDNVCCASSCGQCGGSGCSRRPGGSMKCCSGSISKLKEACTTSEETGCLIPSGRPEVLCAKGIKKGNVCCGSTCGKCGGSGCASRVGGSGKCCIGSIRDKKKTCSSTDEVGCLIP